MDYQVAHTIAIALYSRQSFATKTQRLARLCARLYLYLYRLAVESWNIDLSTKCGSREVEQEIIYKVLFVADEGVVLFNLYVDLYITIYSVVLAGVALSVR